jgi:hypothetical protein
LALCDQLDVEQKLQWDITSEPDATVAALIADAQALIEAHVGRPLESATHTATLDGGRVAYFLRNWPVTAVSSLSEDGVVLTVDDDFKFYPNGKLIRVSASGFQILWKTYKLAAIEVEYTGGYRPSTAAPPGTHDSELEHLGSVCAEVVARAFRLGAKNAAVPVSAGAGGVQSVTLDGRGTVSYATGGGETLTLEGGLGQFVFLNEDERRQLGRYRSLPLGFA